MPPTVLSRSDLASALDFVREGAVAANSRAFRRHVLEELPRLVPSTMTSYNDLSADGEPLLLLDPMDAWTPERERDFMRLATEHPLISHYLRTGDTRPMKISDLMPRRAFRASELYRVVYGPMGVEYQMAVTLPSAPGTVVGIALNRDRRDFAERDRQMLALLQPHLAQLRRDAAEREAGRVGAQMLDRILDDRDQAVLALDRSDGVLAASRGATDLLAAYLARPPRPGALPEGLASWLAQERARGLAPAGQMVVDGRRGTLVARLLRAVEAEESDVILLEERRVGGDRAALAGLGLSRRQAEVLALASRGRTNAEIGVLMGISPRTVQKHLEHVYDRLGVRSRAAATATAVSAIGHAPW